MAYTVAVEHCQCANIEHCQCGQGQVLRSKFANLGPQYTSNNIIEIHCLEELKGSKKLPSNLSSKAILFSSTEVSLGIPCNLASISYGNKHFHRSISTALTKFWAALISSTLLVQLEFYQFVTITFSHLH